MNFHDVDIFIAELKEALTKVAVLWGTRHSIGGSLAIVVAVVLFIAFFIVTIKECMHVTSSLGAGARKRGARHAGVPYDLDSW